MSYERRTTYILNNPDAEKLSKLQFIWRDINRRISSLVTANKRDAAAFGAFFFLAVHTAPHRYKLSRTSLISKQVNTAQLVEHQTVMERVMGSNLCMVIDFYFFLHLFSTSLLNCQHLHKCRPLSHISMKT